jgi:hypothetical protein
MSCQTNAGGSIPGLPSWASGISVFLSEWLPLIINLWLMYEMLDAQEEAESAMEEIAKKSLSAAEQLFDAQMEFRKQDQTVYDYANTQPLYSSCNRDAHAITAKLGITAAINKACATTSRFDCGTRQLIIRDAMKALIVGTESERQSIRQFETDLEDQYLQQHYDSLVSVVSANEPNYLTGAFASSAALWGIQEQSARVQATGAMAGVGYFGGRVLDRIW